MTAPPARLSSSNKSSQRPLAHRSRSSKSADLRDEPRSNDLLEAEASGDPRERGRPIPPRSPGTIPSQTNANINELKKKMEEALAIKQSKPSPESPRGPASGSSEERNLALRRAAAERSSPRADISSTQAPSSALTASTESTQTVKGAPDTPGNVRTPSYPFPRMKMKLPRGISNSSIPSHRPFTLLSPTDVPVPSTAGYPRKLKDTPASECSTPAPGTRFGPSRSMSPVPDPRYPTPNLYNVVLMLNTTPGLDSWWTNVVSVLTEFYGAERASLAVPGDSTDLENVPWCQRASFNINGLEGARPSHLELVPPSEFTLGQHSYEVPPAGQKIEAASDARDASAKHVTTHRKPKLDSRHSFAGFSGIHGDPTSLRRPRGPIRTVSAQSRNTKDISAKGQSFTPTEVVDKSSEDEDVPSTQPSPHVKTISEEWDSDTQSPKVVVYLSPQPLELDIEPLIVQAGVFDLLGRSRPLLLTRQYNENYNERLSSNEQGSQGEQERQVHQKRESVQISKYDTERLPKSIGKGSIRDLSSQKPSKRHGIYGHRAFEEYEQAEPSPWSQSPAPSPAARPDPTESPFFTDTGRVDESAFSQHSPTYDYSEARPLEAIGTDRSKTVIHIPLIPFSSSVDTSLSNLRFPIAILSLLTPITPYPSNLRHSLTNLLPHLACGYSNALQFSSLEARLIGRSPGRYSHVLGLGGTFSDEHSELELVAELGGNLSQTSDHGNRLSRRDGFQSQEESIKESPSVSHSSTPSANQVIYGLSPQPTTPGRTVTEIVDSYFSTKRQKITVVQALSGKQSSQRSLESQSQKGNPTTKGQRQNTDETTYKQNSQAQILGTEINSKSRGTSKRPNVITTHPGLGGSAFEHEDTISHTGSASPASATYHDPFDPLIPRHFSTTSISTQVASRALPDLISQILLNSLPLQLFLAKPKTGELVWTNAKFDAYRSRGQGRARDPWQNIHSDDKERLLKDWKRTLESGSQMTCNVRVKRFASGGDYRWFIFRASTLLSQSGQLLYWIGSFLDVHEQRVSELKAAEAKQAYVRDSKYIALANSIPQIIFEAVEGQGIVSANEQWHSFSGQTLDDAFNLGFAKHVHRDDLRKCGIHSLPARDGPPRLEDLLESLREEQKEHSLASADVSESSDSSGRTVLGAFMTPLPEKVAREPTLSKLVSKGIFVAEQDENGNYSYSTEIRLCSKGGEYRWFLVRLVKVESMVLNDGNATWYGTCTDIHDRKLLERDLNYANSLLNRQMESKTKFFANMSHEIRTPLNGILGSIPWLVESPLDNDQRRTLDTIQNSSNNLRELVDNILDVTKLEAGKMTMIYKWFHVRQLLEEVIDTLGSRAIDKGLELNYTVNLDVPSAVKGDPFRLRQILINLMGNAVKFTDQGEVYTHCSIHSAFDDMPSTEQHTLLLSFEVVDTGRGFCEEDLERLFKHFSQIEGNSAQTDAGSGLGLFLSKQLVEMHGGKMSASGNVGKGAKFIFYVKVGTPSSGDHPKSPSASKYEPKRPLTSDPPSPTRTHESRSTSLGSFNPSPGSSAQAILSPGSPPFVSSPSSGPSIRSASYHHTDRSSLSSMVPTPESIKIEPGPQTERQVFSEIAMAVGPVIKRTISQELTGPDIPPESFHPTTYSIVVICPAQHARAAMKQHIEQVVPHSIAVNVTTITSVEEWMTIVQGPTTPNFTHIVLDLRHTHDVLHFMRQVAATKASIIPTLVIITDHYQKRDIGEQYKAMLHAGRKVYLVTKPVKPSIFAVIFDPAQQRNLSKDRNRDTAQSATQNFKNVAEQVKHAIGGFRFRVLLVEDSDVNRTVIVRYLKKVELNNDQAVNGQSCLDMLYSSPTDHYSLVLCDIQMPIKNGYDTCREIRQWEEAHKRTPIPIMALTANAMPEEKAAAASAGFTDYLTKPVDFNTLGIMMMTLLDRKSPHMFLRDRPDRLGV